MGMTMPGVTPDQARLLIHPGYVAGRWYWSNPVAYSTGAALSATQIRLGAFLVGQQITVSDFAARINTASAGGNLRLAIYAADPITHLPVGTPIGATGNISTASTGLVSAGLAGVDLILPIGLYYAATMADNNVVALRDCNIPAANNSFLIGSTTLANLSSASMITFAFVATSVFGTWPDLSATPATESTGVNEPLIAFKVSAVG